MKKINLLCIFIISIFLFPSVVDATSLYISINCNNVIVGGTGTCTIIGHASGGTIGGIDATISVSGSASMQGSPNMGSAFGFSLLNTPSQIIYGAGNGNNAFTIATFTVKGNSAGSGKVIVSNITASDTNYEDLTANSVSKSFSVSAPATQPPTQPPVTKPTTNTPTVKPTAKPTTNNPRTNRPTTHPTTNSGGNGSDPNLTTNPTTNPSDITSTTSTITSTSEVVTNKVKGSPLVLDYVIVGNFNVTNRDGKYFVTVNYDTESVEVTAGANPKITILGQGTRNLAIGKNVVELVLKNETNETAIVQVIITRPDDLNYYDTLLSLLKVVGYDIKFDKNTKEYTLSVDSSVKELYVIAESDNSDVYISGAGLKKLTKGNNDIHILSQYGDKASTEYVIHINRSYTTTVMGCVAGALIVGLIGTLVYFIKDRKKLLLDHKNEKSKIIADANRTIVANQVAPTLNGQSVIGTGKTNVVPQQVVDKKMPTNPVAVAQSTVIPNNNTISNNVKENISKPFPQVKVIKTKTQVNPKVVQTPVQTQVNSSSQATQQVNTNNTPNTSNNYENS